MRRAQDAVLVVSRIDAATGREVVVAFNNGDDRGDRHRPDRDAGRDLAGRRSARASAKGGLTLTIPPVSARRRRPERRDAEDRRPAKPKLTAKPDALTEYRRSDGDRAR